MRILGSMIWRPDVQKNLAFVLMPFGQPFDGYYEHIIKPAGKSAGLDVLRADEIYGTRAIIEDIWKSIWRADIVVADVTDKNPNVNYELGLCHALGIPAVLITKRIEDVPFDYRHRRCIIYNTDEAKWEEKLTRSLLKTFAAVLIEGAHEPGLQWPYDTSILKFAGSAPMPLSMEMPRQLVLRAVSELVRSISMAYGPRGTNVWINLRQKGSISTRKGSAIANATSSANSMEQSGIEQMRKVAQIMQDRIGDGTKMAMLIAGSLVRSGQMAIDRAVDKTDLLKGIQKATDAALAFIRARSRPVSPASLFQIARTAAGNEKTAQIIVDAMKAAGKDGVVTIEHNTERATTFAVRDGLRLDRGYLSQEFVTDPKNDECVLDDGHILVCDRKLSSMRELLPVLAEVAQSKHPLLVLADDVDGEALAMLVLNKVRGTLSCAAIRAPAHGDHRIDVLRDVALRTGAKILGGELGPSVESAKLDDLGRARRIVVSKDTTTILGGHGNEAAVQSQVENISAAIQRSRDPYERAKLQERLTKLTGSLVVITVGAATELDVEDERYRIESALHTAYASVRDGCVEGGGSTLLECAKQLRSGSCISPAEKAGMEAVSEALTQPFASLVATCGKSQSDVISDQTRLGGDSLIFNVATEELEDVGNCGVLDATDTLITAVQAASSFARLILQTDVWNINEKAQTENG